MTATITATPEPAAVPPRVRLDITTDQATVIPYRVAQDGTRTPVRTYDGGPLTVTGGTAVLYDPEAPIGSPVTYTADGTGVTNSAAVTVTGTAPWLVHPGIPARSMPIRIRGMSDRAADANQSIRYPLRRRFPIVAHDGVRKADTYTLTLATTGAAELAALRALLADLATLLLNVPADKRWLDLGTEYVAVGDLTDANPGGWGRYPGREWKLPCAVVARPGGGTQAFVTYGYSRGLYATYAARRAAHATYGQAFDPA